jgi:Cys-tRNA(Pro)/Cys-tRNA(Cys) deacylase
MAKEKTVKTNAMRMLDKLKIPYDVLTVDIPEFVDGVQMAKLEGVPVQESFKTLVLQGKSREYYVFVLPVEKEIDLKRAASAVGEKSVEMIHVKDITKITGYVRGGCSPLGMKKKFRTVLAAEGCEHESIYVSAGKIGTSMHLKTDDLIRAAEAEVADFAV